MSRLLWILILAVWGTVAVIAYSLAANYSAREAVLRPADTCWPGGCDISFDATRSTLVIFIHPQCPCTTASVRELERLLSRYAERLTVYAIIFQPQQEMDGWNDSGCMRVLTKLSRISICYDDRGNYRTQFKASASGECLLYDSQGVLRFRGGLTSARGHEGPSLGQDCLVRLICNESPPSKESPVFGCALDQRTQE